MPKSTFSEKCKNPTFFCTSGAKVAQNPVAEGGGAGRRNGVDLPRLLARALRKAQKSMRESNGV